MNTNMDILILENFLIKKDKQNDYLKDWKILKKPNETLNLKKNNFTDIEKLYSNIKNVKIGEDYNTTGWIDTNKADIKDIFEIPNELDTSDFIPEVMSKAIVKYWRDEKFGKEMADVLTELLTLAKSKKIKNLESDEKLSQNMYEMF